MADQNVLLIGAGGREHAIAKKLAVSRHVRHIYACPGNAGTARSGLKVSNVEIDIHDHNAVVSWCKSNSISLVIVGPEDPLADGICDSLRSAGINCFGPGAKAAHIESSKEFSKDFMTKHGIPTARWRAFSDAQQACDYIISADHAAVVVKASGLAAGKGVVVARDKEEACKAAIDMLQNRKFGSASETIIIEELLEGEEVSCLAFTDGLTVVCMPPAQDHKRLLDEDRGPNTGGMGAYCPCPFILKDELEFVRSKVLQKTVDALRNDGTPFIGVLYAGLMLTKDGPRVLEFNCRFGDPETQVILPLMESDLFEVARACACGELASIEVKFATDCCTVGIVLASEGYPSTFRKGLSITGVDEAEKKHCASVFYAGAVLDGDIVRTSGGRVATIVATDHDLATSADRARRAAATVEFEGKVYRTDIGLKALKRMLPRATYKDAGVDIDAGDRLVDSIKSLAAATTRLGCKPELGSFAGLFDLHALCYKDPLLVSGTDGVGTKLKIAQTAGIHNHVGVDLVAMCVNDVLCHGAESLFFLDYFACGRLDVGVARTVIEGVSIGCRQANCALLGGETAEMPGMYSPGEYDLAGFAVGIVERDACLPRIDEMREGDIILALSSSGVHSNGFSLVRAIVERAGYSYKALCPYGTTEQTLGDSLLTPTKIYIRSLLPVMKAGLVKGAAHITGGGLPGNIVRILPPALDASIDASLWIVPPVFGFLSHMGNVDTSEMSTTFNCGIGMVVIVSAENESAVHEMITSTGETVWNVGQLLPHVDGQERVIVKGLSAALSRSYQPRPVAVSRAVPQSNGTNGISIKKRVAVLISGSGTNLQALIDSFAHDSTVQISLVISNSATAFGLKRAETAGISTRVLNHKEYKSREEFDEAMQAILISADIDIVCLAGFMRILSSGFVNKWHGRMLNIHPSLLPSFKGAHAHKLAIESGVRVSGCTVHFVAADVDSGAIVIQEAVPVHLGDTEETLAERIKVAEHRAFPEALRLLASGKISLGQDGKIVWS